MKNVFYKNKAESGGGLYIIEKGKSYILIVFLKNIFILESENNIIMADNIFLGNLAKETGGAIKIEKLAPFGLLNNTFKNNEALYGNDYGLFPSRIILVMEAGFTLNYLKIK